MAYTPPDLTTPIILTGGYTPPDLSTSVILCEDRNDLFVRLRISSLLGVRVVVAHEVHQVWLRAPRLLGPVRASIEHQLAGVYVQIPRLLGTVRASIEHQLAGSYVQIPRLLGTVRLRTGRKLQARASLSRLLGPVRTLLVNYVDEWALNGFPPPLVEGYRYAPHDALIRTQMASGGWRQRRRWTGGYRTLSIKCSLDRSRLDNVEAFLDEKGADWFTMGLVTGDNPTGVARPYLVRVTGDLTVNGLYGNDVQISLPLEILPRLGSLSALTICFIDEASYYALDDETGSTIGPCWAEDLADFFAITGGYTTQAICFDVRLGVAAPGPIWPFAAGQIQPCPIFDTPRGTSVIPVDGEYLSGAWLYERIISVFGRGVGQRRPVRIFVDTSGSMRRVTIAKGLDELEANYSNAFIFTEYSCPNERWLRWIINAERGVPDCV